MESSDVLARATALRDEGLDAVEVTRVLNAEGAEWIGKSGEWTAADVGRLFDAVEPRGVDGVAAAGGRSAERQPGLLRSGQQRQCTITGCSCSSFSDADSASFCKCGHSRTDHAAMAEPFRGSDGRRSPREVTSYIALAILLLGCAAVGVVVSAISLCGLSGCSGGGFGPTTPDRSSQLMYMASTALLFGGGATSAYAAPAPRTRTRLLAIFVPAVVVGYVLLALVIGSDLAGAPR